MHSSPVEMSYTDDLLHDLYSSQCGWFSGSMIQYAQQLWVYQTCFSEFPNILYSLSLYCIVLLFFLLGFCDAAENIVCLLYLLPFIESISKSKVRFPTFIFLKYESKNKTLTFFYVALMQIKVEKQTFFIKVHKSQHIPLQNHQIAMLLENHKGQSHLWCRSVDLRTWVTSLWSFHFNPCKKTSRKKSFRTVRIL